MEHKPQQGCIESRSWVNMSFVSTIVMMIEKAFWFGRLQDLLYICHTMPNLARKTQPDESTWSETPGGYHRQWNDSNQAVLCKSSRQISGRGSWAGGYFNSQMNECLISIFVSFSHKFSLRSAFSLSSPTQVARILHPWLGLSSANIMDGWSHLTCVCKSHVDKMWWKSTKPTMSTDGISNQSRGWFTFISKFRAIDRRSRQPGIFLNSRYSFLLVWKEHKAIMYN